MPQLAFDKSMRRTDVNGYLHVASSHLTKEQVVEYAGNQVPGWQALGLDPDKVYKVYRPAEEIKKAVDTFNNLPVLSDHMPVNPDEWEKAQKATIGSTGTDAAAVEEDGETYLDNSLVFYSQEFIDKIEDDSQRELSAGYRYTPVVEAGTFNGQPYDLKQTNIIGNHVVTCEEGRAGDDVVVADSVQPNKTQQTMTKKGRLALKALSGLAMDSKHPSVRQKARSLVNMALDADDGEIEKKEDELIQGLADTQKEEAELKDKEGSKPVGDEGMNAEEILKKIGELLSGASAAKPTVGDEGDDDGKKEEKKEGMAQDAVDKLIKESTDKARAEERARYEATQEVKPLVGELNALAFDSASAVYEHALKTAGVNLEGIDKAAYRGMVRVKIQDAGTAASVVGDSAARTSLKETFPGLKNIKIK